MVHTCSLLFTGTLKFSFFISDPGKDRPQSPSASQKSGNLPTFSAPPFTPPYASCSETATRTCFLPTHRKRRTPQSPILEAESRETGLLVPPHPPLCPVCESAGEAADPVTL